MTAISTAGRYFASAPPVPAACWPDFAGRKASDVCESCMHPLSVHRGPNNRGMTEKVCSVCEAVLASRHELSLVKAHIAEGVALFADYVATATTNPESDSSAEAFAAIMEWLKR